MSTDIEEILSASSPTLPDYCQLGGRVFVVDGNRVNKVIMNSSGDWRPMGAREQVAELGTTFAENASGGLYYGNQVTYAVRRVVTAGGLDVAGGLVLEYKQIPTTKLDGGTSTFKKKVTTRKTTLSNSEYATTQTVKTTAWDGTVTKVVTEYTGDDADDEVGTTETIERPTIAASLKVTPYEYYLPTGTSVSYEIYRSKPENTELLYLVATLTHSQVQALANNIYTDTVLDDNLPAASTIDLSSDGWDMTIPVVRYIRAWKGSLICGGSYKATIAVTGAAGASTISATPAFTVNDIGAYVSIPGEPNTYQLISFDSETSAMTIDGTLSAARTAASSVRYRQDDTLYISRALSGNIEVYSAENGTVVSNQGTDNAITGLAVNGSYAYVFRQNNVEILTGTPTSPQLEPHPSAPPGCRSHATIADSMTPMIFYYAGQNGVWAIKNAEASRISSMIDPILVTEIDHSQDEYAHAVYDPSTQLYHLFLFSTEWEELGIRMPDLMFTYDTLTGSWSRGELSASRSGLFRDSKDEMRAVIGTPGGVAFLNTGDTDGDNTVTGTVVEYTSTTVTLDVNAQEAKILPGQPIHLMAGETSCPSSSIRRIVKSVSGATVTIYGELPEGDITGWRVEIGAIRWRVATPDIGLSGDFDRQLRLDTVAIAHENEEISLPVTVTAQAVGSMDGVEDRVRWKGVFDFCGRGISRIDGKSTGLRGASLSLEIEGGHAPALIKGIRIETTRVAR